MSYKVEYQKQVKDEPTVYKLTDRMGGGITYWMCAGNKWSSAGHKGKFVGPCNPPVDLIRFIQQNDPQFPDLQFALRGERLLGDKDVVTPGYAYLANHFAIQAMVGPTVAHLKRYLIENGDFDEPIEIRTLEIFKRQELFL